VAHFPRASLDGGAVSGKAGEAASVLCVSVADPSLAFTYTRKIAPIFFPSSALAERIVSVRSSIAHTPSAAAM
jgi:hypothetical protein